jgi:hypothetical protein
MISPARVGECPFWFGSARVLAFPGASGGPDEILGVANEFWVVAIVGRLPRSMSLKSGVFSVKTACVRDWTSLRDVVTDEPAVLAKTAQTSEADSAIPSRARRAAQGHRI